MQAPPLCVSRKLGIPRVGRSDEAIAFLTSCVPDLNLESSAVKVDDLLEPGGTDCRGNELFHFIAHTTGSKHDDLELLLVFPSTLRIHEHFCTERCKTG